MIIIIVFTLASCKKVYEHKYIRGICECGEIDPQDEYEYINSCCKYSKKIS